MVKQPPAPLKSAVAPSSTSAAASKQSSSSSSNLSSPNKTVNLSTTSNKKKYGGSGASPNRSRSATKELILPANDAASSPPTFTVGLKSLNIGDGERLTLQCQVAGDPEPQVSWYKDGKKLESNDFVDLKYKYGLATLKIEEVYPEDAGEYKCIAKNYVNSAETVCTLKVMRKLKQMFSEVQITNKILFQQSKVDMEPRENQRAVTTPSLTSHQRSPNI
jgi:hypothetical protein